jgi:hypothetical protein
MLYIFFTTGKLNYSVVGLVPLERLGFGEDRPQMVLRVSLVRLRRVKREGVSDWLGI